MGRGLKQVQWALLPFVLLISQDVVCSDVDFSAWVVGRSYPLGSTINGEYAWNKMVWGERGPGKFLYGYLRPGLNFRTIGLVNSVEPFVDIFPLSFFGFRLGWYVDYRTPSPFLPNIDCASIACTGVLIANRQRARAMGAYGRFSAVSDLRLDRYTSIQSKPNFFEEQGSFVGNSPADRMISTDSKIFFQISGPHRAGINLLRQKFVSSQQTSLFAGGLYYFQGGEWDWALGAGQFVSSVVNPGLSIYGGVVWNHSQSYAPQ